MAKRTETSLTPYESVGKCTKRKYILLCITVYNYEKQTNNTFMHETPIRYFSLFSTRYVVRCSHKRVFVNK